MTMLRRFLSFSLLALLAGCENSPSSPPTPSRLSITIQPPLAPRNRIAFSTQPVIQIEDAYGKAFAQSGVQVVASLVAGGGQLLGDTTVITNASGAAVFTNLELIGTVGPRTLRFSASRLTPINANVTLSAGQTTSLAANGGSSQTASAGTAVITRPSVVLKDADNNLVSGVTVVFLAQPGNGRIAGATQTTDSFGTASVGSWILGDTAGVNALTAATPDLPGTTVQFSATGVPGPARSIVLVGGGSQSAPAGRGIQQAILLRVFDAFGNGVPNADVNFVVSGGGSLSKPNATSLSTGFVTVAAWTLGPNTGQQTATGTVTGASIPAVVVPATAVTTRIVTFGDSNTDWGFIGNNPSIEAASYVSELPSRPTASAPNGSRQLAGKIEQLWTNSYSPAVTAINHGVSSTTTGSPRSPRGAPGARTSVNNVTRFDGEVLGWGFPWNGGEPVNDNYSGPITRSRSYVPTPNDFVYISMGTNDAFNSIQPSETVANLGWMVDRWLQEGLPANHLVLTTIPAVRPENSLIIPEINRSIRALAAGKGVQLLDISVHTSNDDGLTWKAASLHIGDSVHYAESVRDWIAGQVVAKMAAVTAPPQ